MKKIVLALSLCGLFLIQSCQSDDSPSGEDEKVILNTNSESLNGRIDFTGSGVLDLVTSSSISGKVAETEAGTFPMSLLAEVKPPTYDGKTLMATHVDVKDNYVYVSYNTQGDAYLGGIDIIDISSPNNPKLVVQAILPNVDISTVLFDNGKLYITGAVDADSNKVATPAFVAQMPLQSGLLTKEYTLNSLEGYVGTGLAVADSKYYAVSGDNGVIAKLDKNTNVLETTIPVEDLRAMGHIGNKIVVLSGKSGVKVYNAGTLGLESSFTTSVDVADAKRTIDFQGNNVLVSQGSSGLGVYNLTTGKLEQSFAVPTDSGDQDQNDLVTNAVSVNGDYAYVANGAAGISVYKTTDGELKKLGTIDLSGSSNYVKSVGDYIYVASGNGGLKIVKKVTVSSIDCSNFPTYNGGQWLNVNSGDNFSYQGSASLQGINVNQNLTFCGSLAVKQGININSGGVFTMKGSMAQGNYNSNSNNFNFNINGTFKVEGSIVIYGNLIMNSGAKLEFLGSNSEITIHGKVTKNNGVTITGTYKDTFNKLK
ncbi:PQQ-binding-like beta-propeller repeat protein [Flavobacterium sp. FBOR7N2.3]|uniref:PQQ-binding-like beta-propeller repeat protein n=1 Tax=Flavobacterium magnesitis TaxID=3138077 RepID=A0ABV4TNF4_9FLAO